MKSGREHLVDQAVSVRILDGPLAEALYALEATTDEENWALERKLEKARNIRDPLWIN
jgi:hypothetical protein